MTRPIDRDQLPTPPPPNVPNEITAKGTAVLAGLSVVNVPCPTLGPNTLIFHNVLLVSGTLGLVGIVSRTPGVGFAVSTIALNTSTIAWMTIEP